MDSLACGWLWMDMSGGGVLEYVCEYMDASPPAAPTEKYRCGALSTMTGGQIYGVAAITGCEWQMIVNIVSICDRGCRNLVAERLRGETLQNFVQ